MRWTFVAERGHRLRLKDVEPDYHADLDRADAEAVIDRLGDELGELADLLFYAGSHALLVILQGRDTAGKDGTIRRILRYVNAQSCRVVPFKVPVGPEIEHDFLWRVHMQVPGRGSIALFNRSHYEDVLVVRVHKLAPEEVWRRRYDHINAFEELLLDNQTIIVKLLLHISKEEQAERLLERERDTEKAWKLNVSDWQERELWDAYTEAYEDVLERCSTPHAPWHVVPADHKWFRDAAVIRCLVEALRPYREEWLNHLRELAEVRKRELEQYRQQHPG